MSGLPNQLRVAEKQATTLTATLSKPVEKVVWYKDDKPIDTTDSRYKITSSETEHTLSIPETRPDDQSNYSIKFDDQKSTSELIVES